MAFLNYSWKEDVGLSDVILIRESHTSAKSHSLQILLNMMEATMKKIKRQYVLKKSFCLSLLVIFQFHREAKYGVKRRYACHNWIGHVSLWMHSN